VMGGWALAGAEVQAATMATRPRTADRRKNQLRSVRWLA
jgi:hypothetical protein